MNIYQNIMSLFISAGSPDVGLSKPMCVTSNLGIVNNSTAQITDCARVPLVRHSVRACVDIVMNHQQEVYSIRQASPLILTFFVALVGMQDVSAVQMLFANDLSVFMTR